MLFVLLQVFVAGYAGNGPDLVVTAVRTMEPIKVDGVLDEKVWQGEGYGGFIQSDPSEGSPASEKTVVRLAYDNKAIYISAQLLDSEPNKIIGLLGRRDDFVDSDWFIFAVDPYYDRRSGYQFAVNPSGTIVDWTIYNDYDNDSTWDGVWESKTRRDDYGWTVEMRIPFEQLRFKKRDHYTWGVDFRRYIKRKNEQAGLVYVPKKDSGYASHFARLEGMSDINPGRYIELLPYTVGKAAFSSKEEGNPFAKGHDYLGNAGVDMKIGLQSNLTLDLTVNPDFGQVEVDPAVINLSAAESYYDENRPFFIEGADIFRFGGGGSNRNIGANWSNPRFFYTRRIGRSPQGSVRSDGNVDTPEWSTILGAAKITGKIGNGWNVGFINAVTQREFAAIDLDGFRSSEEVEPFTYYGVLRAQKEFNQGKQGLGFITTSVLRNLRTESLKETLNRDAFSVAVDGWTFLDKNNTWVINGWFGGSRVSGSQAVIWDLQHAYPHYFQRPDATHVSLNANATSMSGWAGRVSLNKQKGNFFVNAAFGAISPGFDTRDIGFQWTSDIINGHFMIGYNSYKPGKLFRSWSANLITQRNYDFGGNKMGEQRIIFIGSAKLLNYWDIYFQSSYNPPRWDNELTRGGPLMRVQTNVWMDATISSDNRKAFVFSLSSFFNTSQTGDRGWNLSPELRWKPSSNFSIECAPYYSQEKSTAQWVDGITDPTNTETYGTRYLFGTLDQKVVSCSIRLNWIFSPRLSLQAYIQPFIAVGHYSHYKELARPRSYDFNVFGQGSSTISYDGNEDTFTVDPDGTGKAPAFSISNPDFNYKSLRGTVVLRWEYRPGSILYAVWTQNRADQSDPGNFRFGHDLGNLFKARGNDIFMIKFTYRFKM